MTGKELDRDTQRELSVLESQNAEGVARHLVMAMQYLDVDPAFALEHAQAAVRRGGRVAAVREAAGVAAYVAEDFEVALRELRTHRRMSGNNEHLALIIDSERALGRTDKALETAADPAVAELDTAAQAEVAMVLSGIHQDRGDLAAAKAALEIPGLNKKRAFSYSPRLFSAYADVLDALGQAQEAESWARLAVVAEAALGQGQFEEPEIYEIDVLPDEEEAVELTQDAGDDAADAVAPEASVPDPSASEGASLDAAASEARSTVDVEAADRSAADSTGDDIHTDDTTGPEGPADQAEDGEDFAADAEAAVSTPARRNPEADGPDTSGNPAGTPES